MAKQLPLALSQRWNHRRTMFVPPAATIDVSKHGVELLDSTRSKAFDQVLQTTLAERALPRPLYPDPLPL